jgi:hypothetical protein
MIPVMPPWLPLFKHHFKESASGFTAPRKYLDVQECSFDKIVWIDVGKYPKGGWYIYIYIMSGVSNMIST